MKARNRIVSILLALLMVLGVVPSAIIGIFANDGSAQTGTSSESTEAPAYHTLYAKQENLVYLWTAEGLTPGEEVNSLPNLVDDGATAIDNLMAGGQSFGDDQDKSFNDASDETTNRVVTADGKAVAGDGYWKLDLTDFIPTAASGRYDDSITLEVLQTNLTYGDDRTEANGHVNRRMAFLGLGYMTYHMDVDDSANSNFSYIGFGSVGNSYLTGSTLHTTVGVYLSEKVNNPFTLTMRLTNSNGINHENNTNYHYLNFFRDAYTDNVASDTDTAYIIKYNSEASGDYNGDTREGLRSLAYGIGYEQEAYSAIRLYNVSLTVEDIMQNHFIDLCYMHDVDLSAYVEQDRVTKIALHQLTQGKTADDFDEGELQAAIDAVIEEANAPIETTSEYYKLYARQDKLTFLWTAETLTPGETVNALLNLVDGENIYNKTAGGSMDIGLSQADIPLALQASEDGKFATGDGQYKLALEAVIPNTDGILDRDFTVEVLQTYFVAGDRTADTGFVNHRMYIGPGWMLNYHLDTPGTDGINFSHMSIWNGQDWPQYKTTLGANFSAPLNTSFTISMHFNLDADPANPGGPYTEVFVDRDADMSRRFIAGRNYIARGDDTGDGTANDRAKGLWGFTYGVGFEKEGYSAIRIYDCILTDEEKAQNHFVDIAYILGVDLSDYALASDETKARIHELTVGKDSSDYTKETLQTEVNSFALTDGQLTTADIVDYMIFDGIQARVNDYAAIRLMYSFNKDNLRILTEKEIDYRFGVLYGDADSLTFDDMLIRYNEETEQFEMTNEGYTNAEICHQGVYGDVDTVYKDVDGITHVAVKLPEVSDLTDVDALNHEYIVRAYFAILINGKPIISYLDFNSALFGNSISIARAAEHFLCYGYANSEIISSIVDEDLKFVAQAGQAGFENAKEAYDELLAIIEEMEEMVAVAYGIYDDYLVIRAQIDNSLQWKDAIKFAAPYANTKAQISAYLAVLEAINVDLTAAKDAVLPKLEARAADIAAALTAAGMTDADAIVAQVVGCLEERYGKAVEEFTALQKNLTMVSRYSTNIASASCANILKSRASANAALYLNGTDVSKYTIVADSAYADVVADIQEMLYMQYGALVGVYFVDNGHVTSGNTPAFDKAIYVGMTDDKLDGEKNTYSVYFVEDALYVEADNGRAMVAGITNLIRRYGYADGNINVTSATLGDNLLLGTFRPLVDTNIPVGVPDEIVLDIDTMYNAAGVWECFVQIIEDLPDEITVLDKYDVTEYELSAMNTYFVATNGNDTTGDGTIDKPFATINRALDEVENKKGGVIYVRGGSYTITESITINQFHSGTEDAPLIISAYQDEEVSFTTASVIDGAKFVKASQASFLQQRWVDSLNEFTENNADNVYVVDLNTVGFADGSLGIYDFQPNIFINGTNGIYARWPNLGANDAANDIVNGQVPTFNSAADIISIGYISDQNNTLYDEHVNDPYGFEYYIDTSKFAEHLLRYDSYNEETNPEGRTFMCYGSHCSEYYLQRYGMQIFFDENDRPYVRANKGHSLGIEYHSNQYCFFQGMLEDLDSEREYILDVKNMLLYVYAPGGLAGQEVCIGSDSKNIFNLNSASHVLISGIDATSSTGTAYALNNCEKCVVQCADITAVTTPANISGGQQNAFIYSTTYNTGKITLAGGDIAKMYHGGNIVQNCRLQPWIEGGITMSNGCISLDGIGDVASHNQFIDSTLSPAGLNQIIEYNHFVHGPQNAYDGGPIYGGSRGTHIRNNLFTDLNYSLYGIYMDSTTSGNYIYNNVIEYVEDIQDGAKCINLHSSSMFVVMNNICIRGTRAGVLNNVNFYPQYIDDKSAGGGFVGAGFESVLKNEYLKAYARASTELWASHFPIYNKHYLEYEYPAYQTMMSDPDRNPDGQHLDSEKHAAEIHVRLPKFNVYKDNVFFNCGIHEYRKYSYGGLVTEEDESSVKGHNVSKEDLLIDENNKTEYYFDGETIVEGADGKFAWSAQALEKHPALAEVDLNYFGLTYDID